MGTLFRNGGWGMYPIVVFGLIALATAGYFAVRADGRAKAFLDLMPKVIFWATVTAFASDLIAVAGYFESHEVPDPQVLRILIQGGGESLSTIVFGGAFLMLTYLFTAVGQRKMDAKLG